MAANPLFRFMMSFVHAARGIAIGLATQHNLRIHAAASALVVTAGFALNIAAWEWAAIVLAMMIVWAAELLNTALEFLTDIVSPGTNALAGKAKDCAAGAVLAAAIGAVAVGGIVFIPHF